MIASCLDSQIRAVDKLSKVNCGALFMEPGTGKTRAVLELLQVTNTDLIFWFTPFQTKDNLKKEIDKWGGLECEIIGIESIQLSDRMYLEVINKLGNSSNATIIVDESLKIKNIEAKRTDRLIELSKMAKYRLILNGTPLSKNLLDLYSQMSFLSPKILNMSYAEFKNTFCEYIKITKNGRVIKDFIKQYHNLEHLYSLIEPFVFESKLSLSVGKQYIDIDYKLSDEEQKYYNELKVKYLDDKELQARNNNIFLLITQKLQHSYSLSQEKFEIVDKLLENVDSSKVIIFAKYIETQKRLKEYYKDIEILSIQKHAYGLNKQDYNIIIFWDKTWDYALREHSEHRTFRTGQLNDCIYYDLTTNTGLDKMMNENINKKGRLLNKFKKLSNEKLKEVL